MTLWEDPSSYLLPKTDNSGRYSGSVMLHEMEFRFSLNRHAAGRTLYRGTISAISPADGRVLKHESKDGGVSSVRPVSAELHSNSGTIAAIQDAVSNAALRLYSMYTATIFRSQHGAVRPETITPGLAAYLYGRRYIDITHNIKRQERKEMLFNRLLKSYSLMPSTPMSEYSMAMMSAFLKQNSIGESTQRELSRFWAYCIDKGYCVGASPFRRLKDRKMSAQSRRDRAIRSSILSEQIQETLYNRIMERPDGAGCAIALQLWAGLAPKEIPSLCWRDIVFDPGDPDYVRIRLYYPDTAGYTHIYTRPVFPQAARILYLLYRQAHLKNQSEEALQNAPVAPLQTDHSKPISADDIVKRSSTLLRDCGVSEETFANLKSPGTAVSRRLLKNTYRDNLTRKCGLQNDPYTVKFLCGESLSGDTSSDHYISFTDDDAARRLYTLMRVLAPEERWDSAPQCSIDEQRQAAVYTILPFSTKHCAAVRLRMILMPGESFVLECAHGVTGDVVVREMNEDGTPKRLNPHNAA